MTTAARKARAREAARLYALHGSVRAAAEAMGVSSTAMSDLLSDPDHAKQRARRARYAGVCVDCGGRTDGSAGPGKAPERCLACTRVLQSANRKWPRERVVAAIQEWAAVHGRPPLAMEWLRAEDGHPPFGSVYGPGAPFAYWSDAIVAAGFPRPVAGRYERTGVKGMGGPQFRALAVLRERGGPMSPAGLAWRLDVSNGNAWRLLRGLVARGLVEHEGRGDYRVSQAGWECDMSHVQVERGGSRWKKR